MLPHRHREHWRSALDARLELLWASGKPISLIAAILTEEGHTVTRNAVAGKRKRLGLPSRGSPIGRTRTQHRRANDNQPLEAVA